jgi:hypothetical protein
MSHDMNITHSNVEIAGLAPAEDEVQLWRVDLEAVRAEESCWQEVLSSDERNRAATVNGLLLRARCYGRFWQRS